MESHSLASIFFLSSQCTYISTRLHSLHYSSMFLFLRVFEVAECYCSVPLACVPRGTVQYTFRPYYSMKGSHCSHSKAQAASSYVFPVARSPSASPGAEDACRAGRLRQQKTGSGSGRLASRPSLFCRLLLCSFCTTTNFLRVVIKLPLPKIPKRPRKIKRELILKGKTYSLIDFVKIFV